jgi:hypothetical protein
MDDLECQSYIIDTIQCFECNSGMFRDYLHNEEIGEQNDILTREVQTLNGFTKKIGTIIKTTDNFFAIVVMYSDGYQTCCLPRICKMLFC